jgi:hypothetical protein
VDHSELAEEQVGNQLLLTCKIKKKGSLRSLFFAKNFFV